jgi:hypothetical protein
MMNHSETLRPTEGIRTAVIRNYIAPVLLEVHNVLLQKNNYLAKLFLTHLLYITTFLTAKPF